VAAMEAAGDGVRSKYKRRVIDHPNTAVASKADPTIP